MTDKEFQDRLISELKTMGIGQRKWHTEKGVPIAVVLMFAGQLMWAAWYGSSIASGMVENKDDISENTSDITEIKKTSLTEKDSELLRRGIEQNSKDINKNNIILINNGDALTQLQRTIDRYIGARNNENER